MVNKEIKSIGIFSTTYNRRIEEIALQCCEIIINKNLYSNEQIQDLKIFLNDPDKWRKKYEKNSTN